MCNYSQSRPDDPIVKFGQPGASHSHDFFGNTSTDAFSTYGTLSASKATTCQRTGDSAAYWVPSLNVAGRVLRPVDVDAYYVSGGKARNSVQPFPPGYKFATAWGARTSWLCLDAARKAHNAGKQPTCPTNSHLILNIYFPDCSNGNTDSADHHSHAVFNTQGKCPADYPVPIPQLWLVVEYPTAVGGFKNVTLSSGGVETAHADFFNAWDQTTLEHLVKSCINANVECGSRGP